MCLSHQVEGWLDGFILPTLNWQAFPILNVALRGSLTKLKQSVSNPDETVAVELLKINTLPGLLRCHLLGPGFAFFCGRKGVGEIAYKAGLAHRVFVELHCQKNKRTNRKNKAKQGHLDIGQDGGPSASHLPTAPSPRCLWLIASAPTGFGGPSIPAVGSGLLRSG